MVSLGKILPQMNLSTKQPLISELPDMEDKLVIVTGGSSGVGRDICKRLLLKNAKVYMADECQDRATASIAEIAIETEGKYALLLHLDLSDMNAINETADMFLKKESSLHMLFCIADTVCSTKDKYTAQGYDAQFGSNTLGHLLFIRKLYHRLVSSTTPQHPARVIWASSSLHSRCVSPFNYEALRNTLARSQKFVTPQTLYESSKFAVMQLGLHMSRTTFKDDGVVMILVDHHVRTQISLPNKLKFEVASQFKKPIRSSEWSLLATYLYAATFTPAEPYELQGKYLTSHPRVTKPTPAAEDQVTQQEMWNFCENIIDGYLSGERQDQGDRPV